MDDIYTMFDILGTMAFAISGATTAVRKEFDLLGVVVLGVVTSVGGGALRDIISNNTPEILYEPTTVFLAAVVSVATFLMLYVNLELENPKIYNMIFLISDTLGLAACTIFGMQKVYGMYTVGVVVFFGVVTGIGGSIIRDVLVGETPYVLTKHFYASSCIIGGVVYALLRPWNRGLSAIIGMVVVFGARMLGVKYGWNLPKIHNRDE